MQTVKYLGDWDKDDPEDYEPVDVLLVCEGIEGTALICDIHDTYGVIEVVQWDMAGQCYIPSDQSSVIFDEDNIDNLRIAFTALAVMR